MKKVLVIGDSHAKVFEFPLMKFLYPFCRFKVCSVVGATTSGLENPNSKTNALEIFTKFLQTNGNTKNVIFLLGEVDTGFVIWHRVEKYKSDVNEMLNKAVDNYHSLVYQQKLRGKNVIIVSTPLPTILQYSQNKGAVASARKDINASFEDRLKLTLTFNERMKNLAIKNGFAYLDLDSNTLQKDGKAVKRWLKHYRKSNHHYNNFGYSILIASKLKSNMFVS